MAKKKKLIWHTYDSLYKKSGHTSDDDCGGDDE